MRKLAVMVFVALFCPLPAYAGAGHGGKFTQHYAGSLFEVTGNGLYSVEMLVIGKELKIGMNAVDVIIHDARDHDVMGAEITVTPWMPEMGHGVKEKPVITERGGGLYSVENVEISMPGLWELRVEVRKGKGEDTAIFRFPGVHAAGMTEEHGPTREEAPEGLSLSKIALSQGGLFRVAYLSDETPPPINRVHGWRIYLEDAGGAPVADAEISVDGDMPEHGHGMPTRPVVRRNMGGGVYEVEGMKFQMPGWWVVTHTISSGGATDKALFNLMLK